MMGAMALLSDADMSADEWSRNLKSVIFFGVFILAAMAALIWWLRR
jgi:hypothetical protein